MTRSSGAVDPWLPAARCQNEIVGRAAAAAAGAFASGGYTTVYDGVVGPWSLPAFGADTGLEQLDYVILLPPVDTCVRRVATPQDHGFTDEPATRKMHAEFTDAEIAERHVFRDPPEDPAEVLAHIESARAASELAYALR